MQYQIKRGVTTVATVKPTGQQSKKVMAENTVTMGLSLATAIDLQINDYADVFGERYFLMDLADVEKLSSRKFNYTVTLKGWQYQLAKAAYLFPDADNNYTLAGQSIMGNLETFIDLLITNANRDQTGWVKGVIDDTEYLQVDFNADDTCLTVLATLATKFKVEWWVDGQTIHMTKRGDVEAYTLKYGQGNGLYSLKRVTSTDKALCTRLYAYGSTKNIPADYKGFSDKLKLPGDLPYIEMNVDKYGIIEHTEVFEDIYPKRIGVVTSVGADEFTFTDSAIDFDVNAQLLGVSAKVTFNTGQLAGCVLELSSFNNTTKEFTLKLNKDEKALIVPSPSIKAAVGDQYVITDIGMPTTYIEAGENDVLTRGTEYLTEASTPIVTYSFTPDPLNFKQRNLTLRLGNYVPTIDADLGLNTNLRVIGFTRDLQIPTKYTADLAETVAISAIVRSYVNQENLSKKVNKVTKGLNRTYNDALQAKATADGVKQITDYWGVTIDEAHGIVASGTLLVGSGSVNNAGITGVVDNGEESVRFWAGAAYEDKDTAPFRVLDNGQMVATAGKIGNWSITTAGLENEDTVGAHIKQKISLPGGWKIESSIGVDVDTEGYVARFVNQKPNAFPNFGVFIDVENGTPSVGIDSPTGNIALSIASGDILMGGQRGITQHVAYTLGADTYELHFERGIYIGNVMVP